MPHCNYHNRVTRAYLIHMALRNVISPTTDLEQTVQQLEADTQTLKAIKKIHYIRKLWRPWIFQVGLSTWWTPET